MRASRCLPVTPGTLYLAHFAGAAGATAVLSAPKKCQCRHHGESGNSYRTWYS